MKRKCRGTAHIIQNKQTNVSSEIRQMFERIKYPSLQRLARS